MDFWNPNQTLLGARLRIGSNHLSSIFKSNSTLSDLHVYGECICLCVLILGLGFADGVTAREEIGSVRSEGVRLYE